MSSYLHLFCGPHQLLANTLQVLAIEETPAHSHGGLVQERLWRDRRLPVIAMGQLLGTNTASRQQIVVGADDQDPQACILEVDHVDQLVDIDDRDFTTLAAISDQLSALVDAVHVPQDAAQECLLRLRLPLPDALLANQTIQQPNQPTMQESDHADNA